MERFVKKTVGLEGFSLLQAPNFEGRASGGQKIVPEK